MTEYVSKRVSIEADEITGVDRVNPENEAEGYVVTLETREQIQIPHASGSHHNPVVGDYFITLSDSDRYVCPAAVFGKKYEAA